MSYSKVFYIIIGIILLGLTFCVSCQSERKETGNAQDKQIQTKKNQDLLQLFSNDSISLDLEKNHLLHLSIQNEKKIFDLKSSNIPVKTIEVEWVNPQYICLVTWWSQEQLRYIFLKLNKPNQLLYLDKQIQDMDTVNNTIDYLKSFPDGETRKMKIKDIPIINFNL